MAMFAMVCGSVTAETALEPRTDTKPVGSAYESTLNLLIKEHSEIVLKAFADACTDTNIASDISSNLRVQIT
jgi:hypothetical protein